MREERLGQCLCTRKTFICCVSSGQWSIEGEVVMGRGRGLVRLNDQGTLRVLGSASTRAGRPGAVIVSQEEQQGAGAA